MIPILDIDLYCEKTSEVYMRGHTHCSFERGACSVLRSERTFEKQGNIVPLNKVLPNVSKELSSYFLEMISIMHMFRTQVYCIVKLTIF